MGSAVSRKRAASGGREGRTHTQAKNRVYQVWQESIARRSREACGCGKDDLLVLIVIYTVFVVAASLIAGSISDRTGRRKPIVIIAALVQALSAVLILMSPTFVGTAIAAAVMGVGYGAYMAVSLALATDLLPRPEHHARDLGVVNVAANLGQLLGPSSGRVWWPWSVDSGCCSWPPASSRCSGAVMTIAVRAPARPRSDAASRSPRPAGR